MQQCVTGALRGVVAILVAVGMMSLAGSPAWAEVICAPNQVFAAVDSNNDGIATVQEIRTLAPDNETLQARASDLAAAGITGIQYRDCTPTTGAAVGDVGTRGGTGDDGADDVSAGDEVANVASTEEGVTSDDGTGDGTGGDGDGTGASVPNEPGAACPTTSRADTLALAERWFQAFDAGDLAVFDVLLADNHIHHWGQDVTTDADTFGEMLGVFISAFPDMDTTIDEVIADDGVVVVRWSQTATHDGPFFGIDPTRNTITWTGITIFHITCGQIVESWTELDALGMREQMEAIPTPTSAD